MFAAAGALVASGMGFGIVYLTYRGIEETMYTISPNFSPILGIAPVLGLIEIIMFVSVLYEGTKDLLGLNRNYPIPTNNQNHD